MDRIIRLEQELKLNTMNIRRVQDVKDPAIEKEYRMLILQRSNLKDMLIEEYRKELLERRRDIESLAEDS